MCVHVIILYVCVWIGGGVRVSVCLSLSLSLSLSVCECVCVCSHYPVVIRSLCSCGRCRGLSPPPGRLSAASQTCCGCSRERREDGESVCVRRGGDVQVVHEYGAFPVWEAHLRGPKTPAEPATSAASDIYLIRALGFEHGVSLKRSS